jgi:hypothetical protein
LNRSGLVLVGFGIAILGYALLYSGISTLNPCITPDGTPFGVFQGLTSGVGLLAPTTPAPAKVAA